MEPTLNVFSGENSVRDFMNPGKPAHLPPGGLPENLNPFFDHGVRIFAKLMTFTSFHDVKVIPAFNILAEAHERGDLDGVTTVIENSTSNSIASLRLDSVGISREQQIGPSC